MYFWFFIPLANLENFEPFNVTMRDGVKLAIEVQKREANKQYPVMLEMTPYSRRSSAIRYEEEYWYGNGYLLVIADCRGTGESGGEFEFLAKEGEDGYDLIEWIAKQPWSNGKVVMRGGSYTGANQLHIAAKQPPALKCISPGMNAASTKDELLYIGGAFQLWWSMSWIGRSVNLPNRTAQWGIHRTKIGSSTNR